MKRVLVLLLVMAMTVSLFACSKEKQETKPDESKGKTDVTKEAGTDETAAGEEGELTEENITLRVWHIALDEKRHTAIENAVKRFNEKYPNIKVEEVGHENDPYKTKLATAMASGEEPDLFVHWGGGWLDQFVKEGKVLDVDQWIDEISDEYYESALSLYEIGGKNYGLPYNCGPSVVYYNKQIYEDLGLEVPTTLEEFEHNCDVILENGIKPFALGNASQWPGCLTFIHLSTKYGGAKPFLDAYNRENGGTFESENFIQAAAKIQEWVKKGYYPDGYNATNYDTGGSRSQFYTGMSAHIVQTNGFFANCRSEAPEFFEEKLGTFPYPTIEDGKGTSGEILGGGNGYSIAASTKYPREAFELMHMLTDKNYGQDSVDLAGVISGVKGVTITEPLMKRQQELIENATFMQNFYDQFLPPELAALHKETTYKIFGLEMTPEEAAAAMEKKAVEMLGESK